MALTHMQGAIDALEQVWGLYELNRLQQSQAGITQLDTARRSALIEKIGQEKVEIADSMQVTELDTVLKNEIGTVLGGRTRNEIYRELLLSVISQMWVEYLTKVEALRVSIGMEAYAQRDPLVQYKSQASTMFKELLAEIRSSLVTRMFTYRPSQRVNATIDRERIGEEVVEVQTEEKSSDGEPQTKKKRRRH
jgi:preprotein translocase subunit SecA